MRIQVKSESSNDHGAVAIIIALVTVILFAFAAFAVDVGNAYVSKRNLQNGSDAAALAGAQSLVNERRSCATVAADTTLKTNTQTLADGYANSNRASSTRTGFDVRCSADNRRIEVWYRGGGTTPRVFSSLFGGGNLASEREAVASVGVPATVTGMRPYFMCITDSQALRAASGWLRVAFPNDSCSHQPGNWYTVDCPEDGTGNSSPVIAANTVNGCDAEISIVDLSAAAGDPVAENNLLLAACAGSPALSADRGCLTGNTGNLSSNTISNAWDELLGQSIGLPVFSPGTVVGTGNGARYPIRAILGAKVCGYKWNSKDGVSTDPACAGVVIPAGNENFLWLKFETYQSAGTSRPSTCAIGDASCDFGNRAVSLDQ